MIANILYAAALLVLSPWIVYRMIRHGRYRRGVKQKLFGLSTADASGLLDGKQDAGTIWIHAVSVGEVNLIGPVFDRLVSRYPDRVIVISTSTDSGYDVACRRFGAERVFFCPLDFSWAVRRVLRQLKPDLLLLAELELWPNLIQQARKADVDVMVINARLSDRSARGYQRAAYFTEPVFRSLTRVECQDESSAANFTACGTPAGRIAISGSLKFDHAPETRDCVEVQSRIRWAGVDPWHVVWVVGSTGSGEESMALQIYNRLRDRHGELRLVLVPRHPERFDGVANEIRQQGLLDHRRSRGASLEDSKWENDRVILVDTIGELRYWWGVGTLATVGGSFGDRGGQNMLEPAGYGSAVSFGPDTRNFVQISQRLLDAAAAVRVRDATELQAFIERCLIDVPAADSLGRAARKVVATHRGATDRTMMAIKELLDPTATADRKVA